MQRQFNNKLPFHKKYPFVFNPYSIKNAFKTKNTP
jgi:hypothetical protein